MKDARAIRALIKRMDECQKKKALLPDDCRLILCDAHQVTESQNIGSEYLTLGLYRHWLSHDELEYGKAKIFINTLDSLFEYSKDQPDALVLDFHKVELNALVAESLSTKSLRQDLKKLFTAIGYHFPFLNSYRFWKEFMGTICSLLIDKSFRVDKSINIERFYLSGTKDVMWNIELRSKKGVIIKGKFPMDENPGDFENHSS